MRLRTRPKSKVSDAKMKRLANQGNHGKRVRIKKDPGNDVYQKGYDKGEAEGKARLQKKYDYDKRMWQHHEKENEEYIARLKEDNESYLESLDKLENIITYGTDGKRHTREIQAKDLINTLYEEIDEMYKETLGVKRWAEILEKRIKGLEVAFSVAPEDSFFAGDKDDSWIRNKGY